MQPYDKLADKVSNMVRKDSPAIDSLLKDTGFYSLISNGFKEAYARCGKKIGLGTISLIARETFIHDERVTNTMAVRPELTKTKSMLKTDFSLILADVLGIGRNKSQEFLDLIISSGDFVIVPNILDNNAKMIRPQILTEDELSYIYERICKVNGIEVTTDGWQNFKEGK